MLIINAIVITDIKGVQVYSKNYDESSQIILNTSKWSSGVYLLKLEIEQGNIIKKLVKN